MRISVYVKNLHNNNSKVPKGYDNAWINYWLANNKNYTRVPICPRCGKRLSTDGAHVKKASAEDGKWYIIPLCNDCNEKKDDNKFLVYADLLVPANVDNL